MSASRGRQKGRSDLAQRHVRIYHSMMKTEAWRDLDPVARCVYLELASRYGGPGTNNGRIALSVRDAAVLVVVAVATAARAFVRLEDHGFIVTMQKGSFRLKVKHATEYRLTEFGCDVTNTLATRDYLYWKKNTVPLVRPSVSLVRPIGSNGETEEFKKTLKTPRFGISGETVKPSVSLTSSTHISYQGMGASDASAVAVDAVPKSTRKPRRLAEIGDAK